VSTEKQSHAALEFSGAESGLRQCMMLLMLLSPSPRMDFDGDLKSQAIRFIAKYALCLMRFEISTRLASAYETVGSFGWHPEKPLYQKKGDYPSSCLSQGNGAQDMPNAPDPAVSVIRKTDRSPCSVGSDDGACGCGTTVGVGSC